ncbi:DNA ligase 3 [Zalerion maritima]|uniref:DNA ligase 3 n=1 Tax=Zalerion maritima TaxID=339359 RepID=A0AAD5RM69_9PEZI|nr:DNA ligase 3 [Zalerion maritima]
MSSPAKKRKLNTNQSTGSSRGIEFFFKRQQEVGGSSQSPSKPSESKHKSELIEVSSSGSAAAADSRQLQDDEALARKLQAEWNSKNEPEHVAEGAPEPENAPAASASRVASEPVAESSSKTEQAQASVQPFTLSLQSISTAQDTAALSIPLDHSPLTFDLSQCSASLKSAWDKEGSGRASYALLARCFVLVNATNSRIKIVDTLVNCLRLLIVADPQSLLPAVWLTTNAISPPFESLELGIGSSIISKALKTACGLDSKGLRSLYSRLGDPGDVAFEAKKKSAFTLRKPKPLTINSVYETLVQIAKAQGKGSAEVKQRLVDRLLLAASSGEESRYIVRTLCQNVSSPRPTWQANLAICVKFSEMLIVVQLRIGAVKTTILIALSRAFLLSRPTDASFGVEDPMELSQLPKESLATMYSKAEEAVKATFARRPNYNDLVPALLAHGSSSAFKLQEVCGPKIHVPIVPMLGSPTRDLSEVVSKVGNRAFTAEWKYDGQRAQVHYSIDNNSRPQISIFSRYLENITVQYPDIVAAIPSFLSDERGSTASFVLEGEIVAVSSKDSSTLLPFQTLSSRARKAVEGNNIEVEVCLFIFDLMFLNGNPLLAKPLRERRELLRTRFVQIQGRFMWVRSIDAEIDTDGGGMDTVMEFFREAVSHKCEGLMVKLLDPTPDPTPDANGKDTKPRSRRKPLPATYHPDKRVDSWLKVKKDYDASVADTLDLIPIAAWHGNGRKAKWWSPILLAVRREEDGALEAVCKCMSGFTDKVYREMRDFYDDGKGGGSRDGEVGEEECSSNGDTEPERKNTLPRRPALIEYYGPEPSVWFHPCEVWEIAFADITLSPTYTAAVGLVSEDRGLSLRFPRYLRKRSDKGIDEASTNSFLAALYRKQVAREDKASANCLEAIGELEELGD